MRFKERLVCKIANFTRKRHLERADRFLRLLYNPDTRQKDFIERVIFVDDNLLFKINTSSYLEWSLFFYGGYERFISKLFEHFVRSGATVIDIGANIGIHAIKLGKLVGPTGHVYAFEPHPIVFQKLQENINLNQTLWVKPVQAGASDKSGEFFLKGFDETSSNQGTSCLSMQADNGNNNQNMYKVKVFTLDDWIKAEKLEVVDLIKIDVEGFDVNVLCGAMESIIRFKPIIIFEYCLATNLKNNISLFKDIKNKMLELGYRFYAIRHDFLVDFVEEKESHGNVRILCVPQNQ